MSGEGRSSGDGSSSDRTTAELRAREAVVASMEAAQQNLLQIGPIHYSRRVALCLWLCDLQSLRASDAFGAESQEATRASVLAAFARRKWDEWVEMGYVDLYESEEPPSVGIRRAIARLSGLDVPLALLRPEIARFEDEIAYTLLYLNDDDSVQPAVERVRSVLDDGIPAVNDADFAAWEAAVWLVSEWIDDIMRRTSPLIDAQIAMVDFLRAVRSSDPLLMSELERLEMYIEEVRSTVPGPEGSQSLESRQGHILTRLRADSAYEATGPLRALLVQAAAECMDDERRISFVWGVERELAELTRNSGNIEKALEIVNRSLTRLLDYQRAGSYSFPELSRLVLSDLEFRVELVGQLGDFEGLVLAVQEVFDWAHQASDSPELELWARESVVEKVLVFLESPPEPVRRLPVFEYLRDSVYTAYPDGRLGRFNA